MENSTISIQRGLTLIKKTQKSFPEKPGIYKLSDKLGNILYIGKAKKLKTRTRAYTKQENLSYRHLRMISETYNIEITITDSEVEALLLESNLIKKIKPRYNILLKDDKSFPNILITNNHDFPQIRKHRGKKNNDGYYFGPFSSASSVNKTIDALQRAFLLRNCNDTYFKNRTRPCLQFQIKRCTAPCVGQVNTIDYAQQVKHTKKFLSGKSSEIQKDYAFKMEEASKKLDFENAVIWRNRIRAITHIQSHLNNNINVQGIDNLDVIALNMQNNKTSINITFMRGGSNFGSINFFPLHSKDDNESEIISAFVGQFYSNKVPPQEILLSHKFDEEKLIASALSKIADYKVKFLFPQKGIKYDLISFAKKNAIEALNRKLSEEDNLKNTFIEIADVFNLSKPIERIEIYDNSHIQGKFAVGVMVVIERNGFKKSDYRKFNFELDNNSKGDDFLMMTDMIKRRFKRFGEKTLQESFSKKPNLILIDGGKGHLNSVISALDDLNIIDVNVCAISKGKNRNAGNEKFHMKNMATIEIDNKSKVMFFLQRIRDEAHRFAIMSHRNKRSKAIKSSPLDEIEGIGPTKKKSLLRHFGSAKEVSSASIKDLIKVEGISNKFAKKIFYYFQN